MVDLKSFAMTLFSPGDILKACDLSSLPGSREMLRQPVLPLPVPQGKASPSPAGTQEEAILFTFTSLRCTEY